MVRSSEAHIEEILLRILVDLTGYLEKDVKYHVKELHATLGDYLTSDYREWVFFDSVADALGLDLTNVSPSDWDLLSINEYVRYLTRLPRQSNYLFKEK